MSAMLTGFHPSFDALSACADQSDVDAARTRVGRHVSRCAACSETVAEIRAMGEAAREVELPGAPAGLWSRIERAREREDVEKHAPHADPVPDADSFRDAPALRPTKYVPAPARRAVRRAGIGLLAAAALFGALLLPSPLHRTLSASPDTGTWHFSPANPRPGATVRVRFQPPASFPTQANLMLLGQFTSPLGMAPGAGPFWSALDDSLATLTRTADGDYVGTMSMPSYVAAVALHVAPLHGPYFRRLWDAASSPHLIERPMSLLVGGDASGRPAFPALAAALDLDAERLTSRAYGYSVADTLIRYWPSQPLGYAADHRVGGKRLIDDVIAWFNRGERQYVKFDRRLMAEPTVDADRELAMVRFANRIEEPAEERRWVMRLVREHPADPRTLRAYGMMLSQMLNRPGTPDSVRADLPQADALYEANGHHDLSGELASVAWAVRDSAAAERWAVRSWRETGEHSTYRSDATSWLFRRDSLRPIAIDRLERGLNESCQLPQGRYPAQFTVSRWKWYCLSRRRDSFATLSLLHLDGGDARRALADADSAVASVVDPIDLCVNPAPYRRRGEALLALGDTARAVADLAKGVRYGNPQADVDRTEVGRRLRPAVDSATWTSMTRAAIDARTKCAAEWPRRWRATS